MSYVNVRSPAGAYPYCLAWTLAVGFIFFEILKAQRLNFWVGGDLTQWAMVPVGFAVYLALFVVSVALFPSFLHQRAPRLFPIYLVSSGVALIAAAGVTWLLYLASRDTTLSLLGPTALTAGSIAVVIAFIFVGRRRPVRLAAIATVSAVAGIIAMHHTGHAFILSMQRYNIITAAGVGVGAFVAGVLICSPQFRRPAPRLAIPALAVVIAVAAPVALRALNSPRPTSYATPERLLLITCDALRADYLSVYGGHVEAPNFESLAERSAVFENAYSLAPWTLPSVASLYSSRYPKSHSPGADVQTLVKEETWYGVDDQQRTLAQRLKARGFATALFTGNGLVCQETKDLRGFDHVVRLSDQFAGHTSHWGYLTCLREAVARVAPNLAEQFPVDTTRTLTEYVLAMFRKYPNTPFFVWLHYMDPHSPYYPPDNYRTMTGPWPLLDPHAPKWDTPQHGPRGELPLPPEHQQYARHLYAGEIQYVDYHLGRLFAELDKTNAWDRSVVCFSADHGEEFWDHGRWGHGHTLFEEGVRVPLMIAAPGVAPRRINQPVSHIDLLPTLAEFTTAGRDNRWLGASWAHALRAGKDVPASPIYVQATSHLAPDDPLQMARRDNHKLIVGLATGNQWLYNLHADPHEHHNLAPTNPPPLESLRAALAGWSQSWDFAFGLDPAYAHDAPLNPEALKNLQTLGYID